MLSTVRAEAEPENIWRKVQFGRAQAVTPVLVEPLPIAHDPSLLLAVALTRRGNRDAHRR
jgi:hypothetical protein